ncbi:MAG: hypothetical protein HOP17_04120 [Acidobacteria bacterium]|nr:hypothetical protein [Acidobacteriota bacterium]
MRSIKIFTILIGILVLGSAFSADGQTRKRKTVTKPAATAEKPPPVVAASPEPKAAAAPPKRNERPDFNGAAAIQSAEPIRAAPDRPAYRYEFTQPDFIISRIVIEHGTDGTGTIAFKKKGADEMITDPIKVSALALERINAALTSMNFLDSTENYQYEKDYSHLGIVKFALTRDGRMRDVTYNWTENKDAKTIMNEYRKITNQFVWIFDISLSRENQPLEAPKLFDSLDSMIKRNEISDPYQLEPFLKELSNDERIPLIARNHAVRVLKQFEKERKKDENK